MNLDYFRKRNESLDSTVLRRRVFFDDIHDLDNSSLDRLIAECEVAIQMLQGEHDEADPSEEVHRAHIRHKRNVRKAYRHAALLEKRMRSIDAAEIAQAKG
jgi:hypothetical protein